MPTYRLIHRIGLIAMLAVILAGVFGPTLVSAQATPSASPAASPVPPVNGTASVTSLVTTSADEVSPAEQALAERFRPVLNMTAQEHPCDKAGDVYFPTTVDFVMNNPDIQLKSAETGAVLASPFTAQDLAAAGANTNLDFPGDPRQPECAYEDYFLQMKEQYDLKPTTYAHFYYDPVEGKVWLEYWFYYYFNDWNDTHESDWEMLLMSFNATTAEEALTMTPSFVGYAQHGGGETSTWTSDKLSKQDPDRVIAYASAGSHATYYTASTYIGWGEDGTAFGCDKTLAPYNQYDLDVVVIPSVIDPDGPFAWALYQGRWGEKQAAVYNGPKGLNLGKKWSDPAGAVSTWRDSSLQVPGSKTLGPSTTDLFCRLSASVSKIGTYLGAHPWQAALIFLGVIGILAFLIGRIWTFFLEAIDIYGIELRTFLAIGLLCVPIGFLFNALLVGLMGQPPLSWINEWMNGASGRATGALILGGVQQLAMVLLISPIVIYTMRRIRNGEDISAISCIVGGLKTIPRLAITFGVIVILILAMLIPVIGIPFAIYFAVRWQFFAQASILDGKDNFIDAMRLSGAVVKGKWWRAMGLAVGFQLVGLVPGPLIGILVLIIGGSKVEFANFISSFLYAIFVPISVIGLTMAYHRLKGDVIVEGKVKQSRRDQLGVHEPPPVDPTPPPTGVPAS